MKCACGYEYIENYDEEGVYRVLIGDKDFITTKLTLTYEENKDIYIRIVCVCPKCGTLKIDI